MSIGDAPSHGSVIGLLGAYLTSTIQEDLFVAGKSFSFEDYFTFAAAEVKNFMFDTSSFTGVNLSINPFIFYSTNGPVSIDFYTGSTFNKNGTLLQASNRREGFPFPQSKLRLNPTNLVLGTRFAGDIIPALDKASGNSNQKGLPFEINASINHGFTITNGNGDDNIIQIKMTWFEI